jgi:hypothetical protein
LYREEEFMKKALSVLVCSAVCAAAAAAEAAPPFTADTPSAAGRALYGLDLSDWNANPYGPGFGLRGGYTLSLGVYVGGSFEYFFGAREKEGGSEYSANVWQLRGEVGYEFGLTPALVLRPQLAVGAARWQREDCFGESLAGGESCVETSATDMTVAPGAVALFDLGLLFLSAELQLNAVYGYETWAALLAGVGAGATF